MTRLQTWRDAWVWGVRQHKTAWSIVALLLGTLAFTVPVAATPAYAGTGNQWCDTGGYCPNAWGGGPYVKTYSYSTPNNDFTFVPNIHECNGGYTTTTCPGHNIGAGYAIGGWEFTGNSGDIGLCVGDAFNNQGDAVSGLDRCPSDTYNGDWGTNFVNLVYPGNTCGNGWTLWYNIHWNGYVFTNDSNGKTIYLNSPAGACLHALPPA